MYNVDPIQHARNVWLQAGFIGSWLYERVVENWGNDIQLNRERNSSIPEITGSFYTFIVTIVCSEGSGFSSISRLSK